MIYFSGTYNTKKLVDLTSNTFNNKGYVVKIVDVSKGKVEDTNDYDILVIAYPIYAFNAPYPIINYVKKLNKVSKGIKCLILKDSGEYLSLNNASSLQLERLLKKKNIKVFSEYHYLMPYSFVFRHTDYMAYKMLSTLRQMLPLDIDDFLAGNHHYLKRFIFDRPLSFIFRIQRLGGRLNGRHYKIDYNKCIKCNKCLNNCPAKNITLIEDEYIFGKKCLMCQRCSVNCPRHAISVGFFKKWAIGPAYSFSEVTTYQKEIKPNYCAKSYKRYFEESEKRINHE